MHFWLPYSLFLHIKKMLLHDTRWWVIAACFTCARIWMHAYFWHTNHSFASVCRKTDKCVWSLRTSRSLTPINNSARYTHRPTAPSIWLNTRLLTLFWSVQNRRPLRHSVCLCWPFHISYFTPFNQLPRHNIIRRWQAVYSPPYQRVCWWLGLIKWCMRVEIIVVDFKC